MSGEMTDKQLIDWMEREGYESIFRFDKRGWLTHWTGTTLFPSLRDALRAAYAESQKRK